VAYPDRVARNRGNGTFVLVNGRGAQVEQTSPLAREPFIAVAELAGPAAQGRVILAAPISLSEVESEFASHIESREEVTFDTASLSLRARKVRRLGALTLSEQQIAIPADESAARILANGIVRRGLDRLPWTKSLRQWRDRVMFLRQAQGEVWPDLSDAALAKFADEWLVPALFGKTGAGDLSSDDLTVAVTSLVPRHLHRQIETEMPTHFEAPTGTRVAIDYEAEEGPKIAIRVQELFGLDRHPAIAGGKVPLVVELLSPAHRPVQVTRDLPGFWRGSYASVRTEMRGRYPRHPWPEDPITAPPTRRVKPHGT